MASMRNILIGFEIILAAATCMAGNVIPLRLDLKPKAFDLLLYGERLAFSKEEPLFVILYSDATNIWEARQWQRIKPDEETLSPSADGWNYEARSFEKKPVKVSARAVVNGMAGEVTWDIRLENHTGGTVVGLMGPCLRNVQDRSGGFLAVPSRAGQRIDDPWNTLTNSLQQLAYPVPAGMQYLAYSGKGGGVAFHVLDRDMNYKQFVYGGEGRLMTVVQYPFVPPGGVWQSPAILWQGFTNDWHAAADRYRTWFRSWAQRPQISPSVIAMPIVPGIVIRARPQEDPWLKDVTKSQEVGTYAAAYPKIEAFARRGMSGVHLVGWFGQGHDSTFPDHLPSAAMGGEDGLLKMVARIKQNNLLAIYYLNARLLNVATSPTYQQHKDWEAITEDGKPLQEVIGSETFHVACPGSPGYREHMKREVVRVAEKYGGDGVQLDQIGAARSVLCFDATHGHSTPASAWATGYTAMLDEIYHGVRAVNPKFFCWIEGAWDGAGQYADLSMGGFWPDHPSSKPFPQMYRYTLPEHPMFGDATLGGVPYWCATDAGRAKRIGRQAAVFFIGGDFRDDIGLTLTAPGEAHWFTQGKEALISVYNPTKESQTYVVRLKTKIRPGDAPYASARALAAEADIPLTATADGFSVKVIIPARQVEAVLLTPK